MMSIVGECGTCTTWSFSCAPYAGLTSVSGVSGAGELPEEDDLGLEGSKSGQAAWATE